MDFPIPPRWKDLWEIWDLRAVILLSLFLQTFLILVAPLRRRTFSNWVIMPLWSAYLLADWAANFAVGQISNSQSSKCKSKGDNNNADLLAFWAPFLLVHLGGPDTITAFSLGDNELWLRHLLSLIFQLISPLYVFYLSLPKNQLWFPTILMFIAGIIKYAERTRSLYLARVNIFRNSLLREPDPGPNYAKLMDEYRSKKEANLLTDIKMVPEPPRGAKSVNRVKEGKLKGDEVLLYAYRFFDSFKGLIVDNIFSFRECDESRDFFLKRTAEDAFKVIIIELNFIYDVLFTKVSVVYTTYGYFFRFFSFDLVVISLGLFYVADKGNFKQEDVAITYTLLLGAIALDVIAFIKIITSKWLVVRTGKLPDVNLDDGPSEPTGQTAAEENSEERGLFGKLRRMLCRRWCEHVSTYNLIFYCKHRRRPERQKIMEFFGLSTFFDGVKYVRLEPVTRELRDHIFKELREKSEMADDLETANEVSAAKGDSVLRLEGCGKLLPYIVGFDYDQSLLVWHIATELCYWEEISREDPEAENNHRYFYKLLSDYMLCLLIMQPTMMSAVAGIGQIRFRDTCAEAEKFFSGASDYQRKLNLKNSVLIYSLISSLNYVFFFIIGLVPSILAFVISLFFSIFRPLMHKTCPSVSDYADRKIKEVGTWARRKKYCSSVVDIF